eukprot:CAMPEP_0183363686 /NCGR_PEP_ID=MMETSP0164_2-20130417/76391_1 /TAXON_ID=221442 /ORGANISM="Coccolithus pelagicus ssp braarudi, Strain PLY182g" /LENGTH=153 /DNA_ID=CAMNT_0025538843 /DNA_START=592 /DNA_END=1054 /DNA_ORIENTATION=-
MTSIHSTVHSAQIKVDERSSLRDVLPDAWSAQISPPGEPSRAQMPSGASSQSQPAAHASWSLLLSHPSVSAAASNNLAATHAVEHTGHQVAPAIATQATGRKEVGRSIAQSLPIPAIQRRTPLEVHGVHLLTFLGERCHQRASQALPTTQQRG